jgi:hydroxylysine kinase
VPAVLRVSQAQAAEIAREYYGVAGIAQRLAAEHDDTFRLALADGTSRLLRFSPPDQVSAEVSMHTALLLYLARTAPELPVQRVVAALDGSQELTLGEDGSAPRTVRMTTYLEGRLLESVPPSTALRRDIGATLARLDRALRGFAHPGEARSHLWDLQNFGQLRALLDELPAVQRREALAECLDRFEAVVKPSLAQVRKQVIHTDFHGDNLLADGRRVTGVLDFGDSLSGPVAMDVAVAVCYQLGEPPDPLAPALDVLAGYHAIEDAPIGPADLPLVHDFMLARLAARIIVSQWNVVREPANRDYLMRRTPQAVRHFDLLRAIPADVVLRRLRAACEMP